MSENFLDVQLNRTVWVAMIEQDKIAEAVNLFEIYKKKLSEINSKEAKQELKYSYEILFEKFIKQKRSPATPFHFIRDFKSGNSA